MARDREGSTVRLLIAAALSVAYMTGVLALYGNPVLRGVEGIAGVVLGLYVSSVPARHFLDLLLYGRAGKPRFASRRAFALWILVNSAVLFCGWLTIVVGAVRFTRFSS